LNLKDELALALQLIRKGAENAKPGPFSTAGQEALEYLSRRVGAITKKPITRFEVVEALRENQQ